MRRYHGLFRPSGTFFRHQFSADYTISMFGFDFLTGTRGMPTQSNEEYQIGLTMSGAISAGAYTAGVFDFLIQALDEWEKARNGPGIPNHRVGIKAMSGG